MELVSSCVAISDCRPVMELVPIFGNSLADLNIRSCSSSADNMRVCVCGGGGIQN